MENIRKIHFTCTCSGVETAGHTGHCPKNLVNVR